MRPPRLDLAVGAVAGRVVGVGVRLQPVGDRLDEGGAAARPGPVQRLGQHLVHRDRVVAVHQPPRDAVADRLVGQRGRSGLLGQRYGDREAVVLHQEDGGCLPYGGEVERLVEVALAGAAVADQRERGHLVALQPGGVRQPDRVRKLGGQRGAQRSDPGAGRVVAVVPVTAQQRQHLDRVQAARHRGEGVAVAGEEPVLRTQRQRRGDLARLLPPRGGIDRQPALPGQRGRLLVEPPAPHDGGVQPAQQVRVRTGVLPALAFRRPGAQDAVRLRLGEERRGLGAGAPRGGRGGGVGSWLL